MSQTIIKNILFPTDFSDLSVHALNTAVAMCKRHDAVLHILHVVENRFLIAPPEANMTASYIIPELEKTGVKKLAELEKKIRKKHGVNLTTQMEFGIPSDKIGDIAKKLNCELIVMGTHGASGFREFFIGSNAFNVIKYTTIPVLTVPGKKKVTEFKNILFPIRATRRVMDKYDFIESIIQKNNATLYIAGLSLPGESYNLGPLDEEILELGKSLRLSNTQFKSEHFICKNYAKKVLQIAKKEKVDLIVINASLDYNWQQFFVGPYTQQVVNHSKVPVLSIRPHITGEAFAQNVKEQMRLEPQ